MLDVERARSVIDRLREAADVTIIAAPPIRHAADALVWAQVADGTMLMIDDQRLREEELEGVLRSLDYVRASIVGTVIGRSSRAVDFSKRVAVSG
jgi:Mrp family chromosome partitioning ATPase